MFVVHIISQEIVLDSCFFQWVELSGALSNELIQVEQCLFQCVDIPGFAKCLICDKGNVWYKPNVMCDTCNMRLVLHVMCDSWWTDTIPSQWSALMPDVAMYLSLRLYNYNMWCHIRSVNLYSDLITFSHWPSE